MRIALINEGTYPVVTGGVSTWCDQLVTGISEHEFSLITMTGESPSVCWELPPNISDCQLLPMWGPSPRLRPWQHRSEGRDVAEALAQFWRGVLPPGLDSPVDIEAATLGLRELAEPRQAPLRALIGRHSSVHAILAAYAQHNTEGAGYPLTLKDAAWVATMIDAMFGVMDTDTGAVDVLHAAANGTSGLVALANHWRHGAPILLTEHGVLLRERYLALGPAQASWVAKKVLMRALRAITTVVYQTVRLSAPVSRFNQRWQEQLGAPSHRIVTTYNGIDPEKFPPITTEPDVPTVSFIGRIDPLKDLVNLVQGFRVTADRVPEARLRLFGPTPAGNEPYEALVRAEIEKLELGDSVTFEGPVRGAVPAFVAGHVVALSSISEGLPFTVMEAMMSGRATVSTEVGGVPEIVGPNGIAGVVVPARAPEPLGNALADLLLDDERRETMGVVARSRALDLFQISTFLDNYRHCYDLLGSGMNNRKISRLAPQRVDSVMPAGRPA